MIFTNVSVTLYFKENLLCISNCIKLIITIITIIYITILGAIINLKVGLFKHECVTPNVLLY